MEGLSNMRDMKVERTLGLRGEERQKQECWGLILMLCLNSAPNITQESICSDAEGPCPQPVFCRSVNSQKPMSVRRERGGAFWVPRQEGGGEEGEGKKGSANERDTGWMINIEKKQEGRT